ncbi:hypothetical protein [Deinococcus frigens]|uniref:hypothetical protein n=1 Tax=Deinococcus frigens TaxID=249403 RepID=UPI000497FF95|nr:hypothetical protein [Deinococcus frigens]
MTGVQWACLMVYARNMPDGPQRRAVGLLCVRNKPARFTTAMITAGGLGLIVRGKLTAEGDALARTVLRREGLGMVAP